MAEKLMSRRLPKTEVLDGPIQNEWWYGATGTGKSKLAWDKYGKICFQKMLNKWWDGYCDEPVVVIEEWSPKNEVTASALKIWADRYPFTAQIKGGVLQKIRPRKIVVLSNYRLSDCFPDNRDLEPLQRRFTEIKFPDEKQRADFRANALLENLRSQVDHEDITESTVDTADETCATPANSTSGYQSDVETQPSCHDWNWAAMDTEILASDWLYEG